MFGSFFHWRRQIGALWHVPLNFQQYSNSHFYLIPYSLSLWKRAREIGNDRRSITLR